MKTFAVIARPKAVACLSATFRQAIQEPGFHLVSKLRLGNQKEAGPASDGIGN